MRTFAGLLFGALLVLISYWTGYMNGDAHLRERTVVKLYDTRPNPIAAIGPYFGKCVSINDYVACATER